AVLASDASVVGQTLQLADPTPITTRDIFDRIAESMNGSRSKVTVPARLVESSLMLPPSPAITGLPHHGVPYFFLKQMYDTTQATTALGRHGVRCPPFNCYVQNIVAFAQENPHLQ